MRLPPPTYRLRGVIISLDGQEIDQMRHIAKRERADPDADLNAEVRLLNTIQEARRYAQREFEKYLLTMGISSLLH